MNKMQYKENVIMDNQKILKGLVMSMLFTTACGGTMSLAANAVSSSGDLIVSSITGSQTFNTVTVTSNQEAKVQQGNKSYEDILDVKNSSIHGIDGMKVSGWRQTKGKTEDDTDSSIISLGSSSQNKITVENSYAEMIRGISLDSNSHLQMKEHGDVSVQQNGGDSQTLTGILLMDKSKMNVGSQGNVSLIQSGGKTDQMVGFLLDDQSFVEMAQNEKISIVQNGGQSNIIYGIYNSNGSTFTASDGMRTELSLKGDGINNYGIGLYNHIKSSMTVGNNNRVVVSLQSAGTNSFGGTARGIQNALSNAQFGNNLSIQVQAVNYKVAEGIRNSGVDATPAK